VVVGEVVGTPSASSAWFSPSSSPASSFSSSKKSSAKRGTWHCLVEGYLASLHDFVILKVKHPIGSRMISISKENPITRPSLKLVEFSFLRIKHLQPKTRK
jgi:hypothetical protein